MTKHTNNKSFYIQIVTSKKKYPIYSYEMKSSEVKFFNVLIININ